MSVHAKIELPIEAIVSGERTIQSAIPVVTAENLTRPGMLRSVWRSVLCWHQKRESRRALRDMTDTELLDIGLSRAQARQEASKSFFWD